MSIGDFDIPVATDGYGAYEVSNTKTWRTTPTPPGGGGSGCRIGCARFFTVDWDHNITITCLLDNDRLAEDMLCLAPMANTTYSWSRELAPLRSMESGIT